MRISKISAVLAAVILSSVSTYSVAEGKLMEVIPKDNSVVKTFDNKVSLAFSGNVSERTPTLVVVDGTGTRVDRQDASLTLGSRSVLSASTRPLAPGRYVIRYRVVTEDGLIVSGISRFEIKV